MKSAMKPLAWRLALRLWSIQPFWLLTKPHQVWRCPLCLFHMFFEPQEWELRQRMKPSA